MITELKKGNIPMYDYVHVLQTMEERRKKTNRLGKKMTWRFILSLLGLSISVGGALSSKWWTMQSMFLSDIISWTGVAIFVFSWTTYCLLYKKLT